MKSFEHFVLMVQVTCVLILRANGQSEVSEMGQKPHENASANFEQRRQVTSWGWCALAAFSANVAKARVENDVTDGPSCVPSIFHTQSWRTSAARKISAQTRNEALADA
jgi:hypothetical protein